MNSSDEGRTSRGCTRGSPCSINLPGDDTGGATPVPIPNTEVKPSRADGTALATAWESRSLPGLIQDEGGEAPPSSFPSRQRTDCAGEARVRTRLIRRPGVTTRAFVCSVPKEAQPANAVQRAS